MGNQLMSLSFVMYYMWMGMSGYLYLWSLLTLLLCMIYIVNKLATHTFLWQANSWICHNRDKNIIQCNGNKKTSDIPKTLISTDCKADVKFFQHGKGLLFLSHFVSISLKQSSVRRLSIWITSRVVGLISTAIPILRHLWRAGQRWELTEEMSLGFSKAVESTAK